jgi:hypothetical protein
MKAMCLVLVLAATAPVLAESAQQPAAQSSRQSRDARDTAQPVTHWDSLRKQLPASPKPGTEKPLGTG